MALSRIVRGIAIALTLVALSFLAIRPAAAEQADQSHESDPTHEGYGVFTVEGRHPGGDGTIHYVVRLTWSADGHPADAASVTAIAYSPAGVPSAPVAFVPLDADGRYGGTVALPTAGWWTVQLTSPYPAGSLTFPDQALAG